MSETEAICLPSKEFLTEAAKGSMQRYYAELLASQNYCGHVSQLVRGKAKSYLGHYDSHQAAYMRRIGALFTPGPRGGISGGHYHF